MPQQENTGGCLEPLSDVVIVKEPKEDVVRTPLPAITPALVEDVPAGAVDAPVDAFGAEKPAEV